MEGAGPPVRGALGSRGGLWGRSGGLGASGRDWAGSGGVGGVGEPRYREYGRDLGVLRRTGEVWGVPWWGSGRGAEGVGVFGGVLGTGDAEEGEPPEWGDLGVCVEGGSVLGLGQF